MAMAVSAAPNRLGYNRSGRIRRRIRLRNPGTMIEWYFPWQHLDFLLKLGLIVWLSVIAASCWIFWRTVVRRKPWLRRPGSDT